MLVTSQHSNIDSGCLTGVRFCFVRMQADRCARMAAIRRVCRLFGIGSILERDKYSLIVNGALNGTGRGLWSILACIVVCGLVDPRPADRTICKYGTYGTETGTPAKRYLMANVIYVTYCVSGSTRAITFVMILFTLINEILYCYSNNNTDICNVPIWERVFEIMKCAKTLGGLCRRE